MKLGIGIDTGGTYTDSVIYDYESRKILSSAKALTTKYDLKVGILQAIDGLDKELLSKVKIISLSTTLATNACVEDKGGNAKLIFFGGEEEIINKYGKSYGLPEASDILLMEGSSNFSGETTKEPDWALFEEQLNCGFENLDGVGIIEMNSMKNGAVNEKKAKEIVEKKLNIPAVCSHELFNELNSLRRGASTLLNARLFPTIKEFLASVKLALKERGICPEAIFIVKSNGGLMNEEFAAFRPVETLLCGPAASAMGCTYLAKSKNSLVVDMGGTTTDIAIIKDGKPVSVTGGVSIGKWKTFVNGLYVKTLGLGGDSAVHYKGDVLYLEPNRVIPLCVLGETYPEVLETLKNIGVKKHSKYLYEHFVLVKDIENLSRYTDFEKEFCRALKKAPLSLQDGAKAVGKDIYTLKVDRLVKEGVVAISGLTPTDIMHIKGDFTKYNRQASLLGAEFVAFNLGVTVDELCQRVYEEVKKKLYINIVSALLENKYPKYLKGEIPKEVLGFIEDSFYEAKEQNPLFTVNFATEFTLVGVGAPIKVFLEDVGKLLNTKVYIPENYSVANALGAVVGSISSKALVEIAPFEEGGFRVFTLKGNKNFEDIDDALEYAKEQAVNEAKEKLLAQGAKGEITFSVNVENNEAQAKDSVVYLGSKVTVFAGSTVGF